MMNIRNPIEKFCNIMSGNIQFPHVVTDVCFENICHIIANPIELSEFRKLLHSLSVNKLYDNVIIKNSSNEFTFMLEMVSINGIILRPKLNVGYIYHQDMKTHRWIVELNYSENINYVRSLLNK